MDWSIAPAPPTTVPARTPASGGAHHMMHDVAFVELLYMFTALQAGGGAGQVAQ